MDQCFECFLGTVQWALFIGHCRIQALRCTGGALKSLTAHAVRWLQESRPDKRAMDSGKRARRKPVGDGVPSACWAQCLNGHVQECLASDVAPFPIGAYAQIRRSQGAYLQSVLSTHHLLKTMFTRAPGGIVNYTKLCLGLEVLVSKWPQLNSTTKPADQWASGLAQSIRCAMGHCRLMVQQPKKFEQRSKLLSSEAKQQLKELLALYKEPKIGEVFVDSQDAEDCGGTVRQLRQVDTDDLDFSWPGITGGSPPKKKANVHQVPMQKEATVQKQAPAQVQLTRHFTASCLIEALSGEPVHPALKQTLQQKPAGAVQKRPAHANQQKEEAVAKAEQAEAEEEEGVEEEADRQEAEAEDEEDGAEEGEKGDEEEEGEEEAEEEAGEQATGRQVRMTRARNRTYIQEKDQGGTWRLIVQVTEKASEKHREVVQRILSAMKQDMAIGKEQALALKSAMLHWH